MSGEKILRRLVERNFLQTVIKTLDKILSLITVRIMQCFIPIEQNKIVFITFRGSYDCNPKWICEEIIRRNLPYQLVWIYRANAISGAEDFPLKVKLVRRGSLDSFIELSSARIIVDNGTNISLEQYKKKRSQYLIETWHGSLGIKKFSPDAVKDKRWVKRTTIEGKMTNVCISNSTFEENEVYRKTYWKTTDVWSYGHARNDILFELNKEQTKRIKEKVFSSFDIPTGTKICLYAPTFRDDHDLSPYTINYKGLLKALKSRFGGEWVIMVRFHWHVQKLLEKFGGADGLLKDVIDAGIYPDIQELAVCTEVALTDYSSWICEYMLTRRPGFLYVTDMEDYQKKDRPFFFPLETWPFPVANSQDELEKNILSFDNDLYVQRCNSFLQEMGCIDDGHAAERTVDEIIKIIQNKER